MPSLIRWRRGHTFRAVSGKTRIHGEDHGLHSGNIKPLPASRILAHQNVVEASHVRLRLGKLCPIAFIRIPPQRLLLGADQPSNFVGVRLPAIHAGEVGRLPGFALVEKVSLIHRKPILVLFVREGQRHLGKTIVGELGDSIGKNPTLGAAVVVGHVVDLRLNPLIAKSFLN